ncbi:hypothetical protein RU86_GL000618 [Lactococcus piscium]|uniref:Uncharacterized protein n=1 Tax=Pseudolactococcus piscium TaxID=1364 RepID=A0A2A5RWL7_9LACT|nr:hypothetical protein [Lactococcus piscium]PCS05611.1 hypothetical protein RU86_GL000618 [Lactococcus piscium]
MIKKKIRYRDNDIYSLSESKRFFIINDNYKGLVLYDLNFNFIKKISISEELLIYELYTSKIDDKIVIFDGEHQKLYILDLYLESNIVSIDRDEIFLNYFKSCKNSFMLRDNKFEYQFSFDTGQEVSRIQYKYEHILSMNENKILIEKNNKLYIIKDKSESYLDKIYIDDVFYIISKNYLITFNEECLFVELKKFRKQIISINPNYLLRKVLINDDILTILMDSKNNEKSVIFQLDLFEILTNKKTIPIELY